MMIWREVGKESSEQSLWIERKKFCVSPLTPGSSIRVVEMLKYRRFSVDFKPNEIPWFIGALREAGKVTSGAVFSKKATFGSRSMVLSIESNRAGVFVKMLCDFGGWKRRLLLIPAGEKREGWAKLANLLAKFSSGVEYEAKNLATPSSNHRSGKGKESSKGKRVVAEGWTEGFLPDLLKFGLDLCVGAPSSSDEASRSFAWKTMESEFGFGTLVVEKIPRSHVQCMKLSIVSKVDDSGGAGLTGEGTEKEFLCVQPSDMAGVSSYGNHAFEIQNHHALTDAPATEQLGSGPSTAGLQCVLAVACAMLIDTRLAVRPAFSAEVNRDMTANRAPICKSPVSVMDDKRAEQTWDIRFGDGTMTASSVPTMDGPGLADRGDGVSYKGLPTGSEEISHLVTPDRSYGGAPLGMGFQLDDKTNTHQSLESHSSLSAEDLSSSREVNIYSDMSFLARYEDITISDNEEALSFDSPVVDCRFRVLEERSTEDGVRCPDECLTDSEKDQWAFNLVEKMCQIGHIRQEDKALIQAHIIKDLLQDA